MNQNQDVEVITYTMTPEDFIADLHKGLTWLKKDDLGNGSIQEKYGATEDQINKIKKLPQLVNAKTRVVKFNIVSKRADQEEAQEVKPMVKQETVPVETDSTDELSAFANL